MSLFSEDLDYLCDYSDGPLLPPIRPDGKVTPEYIASAVEEYVIFHNKTVEHVSKFYMYEMDRFCAFQQLMCNRYMEKRVPMADVQLEAFSQIARPIINSWFYTVQKQGGIIGTELEYLRAQCTRPLTEQECPVKKFLDQTENNEIYKNYLVQIQSSMRDALETAEAFRKEEMLEMQAEFRKHEARKEEWLRDLGRTSDNPLTVEDVRVVLERNAIYNDLNVDQFKQVREESARQFNEFLETEEAVLEASLETAARACREQMDDLVRAGNVGCSDVVQKLRDSETARIAAFAAHGRRYLEQISGRVKRAQGQVRGGPVIDISLHFTDVMEDKLDTLIAKRQSALTAHQKTFLEYRREEREQIRKAHSVQLADHEKFLLNDRDPVNAVPEIALEAFEEHKSLLGSGGEGSVFRYELPGQLLGYEREWVTVAVKKFEKAGSRSSKRTWVEDRGGCEEILALSKLRHPNIVHLLGRGLLACERYLIVEYCPRSLADVLDAARDADKFLRPADFKTWAHNIAAGMRYVHQEHGHHGDLKPQNILIDDKDTARIADFGLATPPVSRNATVTEHKGTLRYMAPEQHAGAPLNADALKRCDSWAYGVVLWEMMTCAVPYAGLKDHELAMRLGRNDEASCLPLPRECECETLRNIIKGQLSDSVHRPSFYTLMTTKRTFAALGEEIMQEGKSERLWREECNRWRRAILERD